MSGLNGVQGQEATPRGVFEEIVVTAEFREAGLQNTPIAITAVTGEMMEARSQTNLYQVASQAPNVTLKPAGAGFGPSMVSYIRGIGQSDFIFALEPGVGIYVDDVYHSTLTGSLLELLDLERVEVLRGPQGTLAGKNSIGGAIKLYSKAPGEGDGSAQVTYGTLDRTEVRATGDFTVVPDKLNVRISGSAQHRDGYVDVLDYGCTHPGSGAPIGRQSDGCKIDEHGDKSYVSGRIFMRWTPSNDIDVDLIADVVDDNSGTPAGVLLYGHNPDAVEEGFSVDDGDPETPPVFYQNHVFVPYGEFHDPSDPVTDPYVNYGTMLDNTETQNGVNVPWKPLSLDSANGLEMWGVSGKIDWQINETLSLVSISAYRTYDSIFADDRDFSPVALSMIDNRVSHEQWSQELRLSGTSLENLVDWTVGGFYFDQKNFYEARVDLNYAGLDFIHGPDPTPATTWALFGHTTFHVTDRLNLSGGIRYSDEEKDYTHFRHNPDGTVPGPPPSPNFQVGPVNGLTARFRDTRIDWRVALDYQWAENFMTYAQVSTGYKGGGVNPRPFFPQQLQTFDPETLTAYEIGFKSTILDQRLRLNAAAFYNDYENIQLTLNECERPSPPFPTPIGAPCAKPSNVGTAEVKGAELELEFYPVDRFTIDGSLSYLDFDYTEVQSGALSSTPDPLANVTPYTPEWKLSGGVQYAFPETELGHFTARLDASYQSKIYTEAANGPLNRIDGYTLINARVWWISDDEDWEIAGEVRNLTDKLYYLTKFDQAGSVGQVSGQPGLPRQWAITVKRSF